MADSRCDICFDERPRWQRVVEYALILACALMTVYVCFFADLAAATPFVWVDTVNGDDASADPWQPNTPVRTYARAIELGANGDTVGVKIKPGSAQPTDEEAFVIISRKPDIVRTRQKKEVLPGHGELPDVDREESTEAGIAIVHTWRWVVMQAANGQLFETCVDVEMTVEDY